MTFILLLIIAVAGFNLVSSLVMMVTDKRKDIAILRTLGASPKSIMGIFMGFFLVFLLIILQIYNSSLILENVDVDWSALES